MNQDYINLLIGALGILGGFIIRAIWESVKDLQESDKQLTDKVSAIEVLVAGNYVKRDYFENIAVRFENKLDKLVEIVSKKADK